MRALLVVLALVAAACVPEAEIDGQFVPSESAAPMAEQAEESSLAAPEVVDTECPVLELPEDFPETLDPEGGVSCGVVLLPEDRDEPGGPVVEVAYTLIEALPPPEGRVSGDMLVVLADGPGDAATDETVNWLTSAIRTERDILLLDARGAGRSFPSLDCGLPPAPGALPLDLVQDCRRDLTADGIDLDAYDTEAIAHDVVDVMSVLADDWSMLGVGHGGKVALQVMAGQPDGLRAVVLDSPFPQEVAVYEERPRNAQAALNRLFDECAQSPGCGAAYDDLRRRTETTIASLNATRPDPDEVDVITGDDLVRATLAAMRGADGLAVIPAALDLAAQDDPATALEVLQEAAVAGATVPSSTFAEGLLLSSDCADEVPFASTEDPGGLDEIGEVLADEVAALRTACEVWNVTTAGRPATQPVVAGVPTLVLTGEFDPLSPPVWGAAVAARLPTAQVTQVDGAGHRVHDVDNCTVALVAEFLRRPLRTLNDACARDRVVDFVIS